MKDNFEYALQFALDKHKGQLDKGWTPYIQHILGVWSRLRFEDMTTQIGGLLHDTVEDTHTQYAEIFEKFGDDVGDIVGVLTHVKGQPYDEYIESIASSGNIRAIRIKIADLEDNSSDVRLQRLPKDKAGYFAKRAIDKYGPAKIRLSIRLAALQTIPAPDLRPGQQRLRITSDVKIA